MWCNTPNHILQRALSANDRKKLDADLYTVSVARHTSSKAAASVLFQYAYISDTSKDWREVNATHLSTVFCYNIYLHFYS